MTTDRIRGRIEASKEETEKMSMGNWIRRFTTCGMPEEMAAQIVAYLFRTNRITDLMRMLRIIEDATGAKNK